MASIGEVRVSGIVKLGMSCVGVDEPSVGARLGQKLTSFWSWGWATRVTVNRDRRMAAIDAPLFASLGTDALNSLLMPQWIACSHHSATEQRAYMTSVPKRMKTGRHMHCA
jgi:hypothetical protein